MPTIEARRQTKRGRFYEIPQQLTQTMALYPSVTTILTAIGKPALVNWAAKVEREMVVEEAYKLAAATHSELMMKEKSWKLSLISRLGEKKSSEKELAKAGEIGTTVHKWIEELIKGFMGLPAKEIVESELSTPVLIALKHFADWAKSVDLEPVASEQVIWSHTHRYAGTLDLLARVNGKLAVIDWKTGKYVYNEAHLQNAAYRQAVREMGHGDPELGIIVRLPKTIEDPKFEAVVADAEAPSMEVFLNVQKLWLWLEERNAQWEATQ